MPSLKYSLPGDQRFNTLMSIVALLQKHGELSLEELSKRFDVQPKTMRGMLSTLNTASFMPRNAEEQLPYFIDLDRVDDDGVVCLELDEGPQGVPRITRPQSVALLAGLAYLRSLPATSDPTEIDELIELLANDQSQALEISLQPTVADPDLTVLINAIKRDHRISCLYVNSKGESSRREIDPIVVVSHENQWFLRGFCLKNQEIRTFRLDRMVDAAEMTEERGVEAKTSGSNPEELSAIYAPAPGDFEVVLDLQPEARQLASMAVEVDEIGDSEEPVLRVKLKLGYLPDLGPLVTRFGAHVRVVSPVEAKEVVRDFAKKALEANLSFANLD